MAVTQIRYPGTPGRVYYERKRAEGKTPKEALRCLKRRLSDLVYCQLLTDRRGTNRTCGSPTTPPLARATSTSPVTPSPPGAPCPPPGPPTRPPCPPGTGGFTARAGKAAPPGGAKFRPATPRLHHDLLDQAETSD